MRIQFQIIKYILIIILTAIVSGGGVYLWQQNTKQTSSALTKQESSPVLTQLQTYTDQNYSFQYPDQYQIKEEIKPERIEVVGKKGRLSIFQLKSPSGERVTNIGFSSTSPENTPQDLFVLENEQTWFDVWLYYDQNDQSTKEELMSIYRSIKLE